jgi:hypothetical protein
MLMILPRPAGTMCPRTARAQKNWPLRLIATTLFHWPVGYWWTGKGRIANPCIVDQDLDAAESPYGLGNHGIDRTFVRDVAGHRQGAPT